jgi:hypothetical protein
MMFVGWSFARLQLISLATVSRDVTPSTATQVAIRPEKGCTIDRCCVVVTYINYLHHT